MSESMAGKDLLTAARSVRLVCVGDVMLYVRVSGAIERISPRAPAAVLRIERDATMVA